MSLLEVQDLSVSFKVEGGTLEAVRHVSFRIDKGETLALVGESGSGKSVTALSILQLLPYPKAWHPGGSIRLDGQELVGADERTLREVRGDRVAIIFQEPMTSLNPLHTIDAPDRRDADAASRAEQADARRARARAAASGAAAGGRGAPRRLSASALRRPAPARDDRDGARQRAGSADRRRADHRARRHHPGADPELAAGPAAPPRHGDAADHPRPHHRAQGRRSRLRDDRGRDRRERAGRGGVRAPAASLHPASARGRAQGAAAQSRRRCAGRDGRRRGQGAFPDPARPAAPHRRPRQGGRRRRRDRAPRPDRRRGRRERLRQDHARPGAAAPAQERGQHPLSRPGHPGLVVAAAAAAAARHADRVPGPVRQPLAAHVGRRRSSRRG